MAESMRGVIRERGVGRYRRIRGETRNFVDLVYTVMQETRCRLH